MASKPVVLVTRRFANQRDASAYFRAMLHRYQPGDTVDDGDALDLIALLERHPEHRHKVGCGVAGFAVMAAEYGSQCFRILRSDGSGTDFSYLSCIKGQAPSRKQEVAEALRHVVRADLLRARYKFCAEHRDAQGRLSCAVTGERIRRDDGHMDHRPPFTFELLVTMFLTDRGLDVADVPITTGRDNQMIVEITDAALAEEFRRYHQRHARLDFVKASINLAQSARHRIRPTRISLNEED